MSKIRKDLDTTATLTRALDALETYFEQQVDNHQFLNPHLVDAYEALATLSAFNDTL